METPTLIHSHSLSFTLIHSQSLSHIPGISLLLEPAFAPLLSSGGRCFLLAGFPSVLVVLSSLAARFHSGFGVAFAVSARWLSPFISVLLSCSALDAPWGIPSAETGPVPWVFGVYTVARGIS